MGDRGCRSKGRASYNVESSYAHRETTPHVNGEDFWLIRLDEEEIISVEGEVARQPAYDAPGSVRAMAVPVPTVPVGVAARWG